MYKIPAETLFLGKNLVFVPECHSTNTLLSEMSAKSDLPEGTLVIADHQTAGRGQRGNQWVAQPGQNFTFSFLLKPKALAASLQFQLNMALSLGVLGYLQQKQLGRLRIKWPNDILVGDKKICGLLIENTLRGIFIDRSVVGIGLNVNQTDFALNSATSLALELNRPSVLPGELPLLLQQLEARLLEHHRGCLSQQKEEYLQHLYGYQQARTFVAGHGKFTGSIVGVSHEGRLQVEANGQLRHYGVQEIAFA